MSKAPFFACAKVKGALLVMLSDRFILDYT